jgi:hypothetical protein
LGAAPPRFLLHDFSGLLSWRVVDKWQPVSLHLHKDEWIGLGYQEWRIRFCQKRNWK